MKRSAAIITTTFAVLAMSSCSTIRQFHLAPEGDTPTPTTVYVVDIGTPLAPAVAETDACPTGQECPESGSPTTTTVAPQAIEAPCAPEGLTGTCPSPSGSVPSTTVPNSTPAPVCGGNVTGECN